MSIPTAKLVFSTHAKKNSGRIRWKLAVLTGFTVAFITFIPQIYVCLERGREWQGSYALMDTDELVYSAYVNALLDGKPRRNNPYLSAPPSSLHESYFSIQFLPPYLVALIARLSRLSTPTVFLLLLPLMAFASALAVFWLLRELMGEDLAAAVGVLIVLLCGVFASPAPITAHNNFYAEFSFLRRYIPALPFPLFFIFCVFMWRSYTRTALKSIWWTVGAAFVFILMMYSYFFLWTAALAWLVCLTALWLVLRPDERGTILKSFLLFLLVVCAASIPYFSLISHRSFEIDRDQALVLTHVPDLLRFTEILGALIFATLLFCIFRGAVRKESRKVIFVAACALAPFVALNQQVVTGRSLQPFHYEQFILNYHLLVGVVVLDWLALKLFRRWRVLVTAITLVIGLTLALKSTIVNSRQNLSRDEVVPIYRRLNDHFSANTSVGSALFGHTLLAADAATNCSIPALWSPYMYTYGTMNIDEHRERFFQYLYYLGIDREGLRTLLQEESVYRGALFGVPRINKTLIQNFVPITAEEINAELESYSLYKANFTAAQARKWPLSYVVIPVGYPQSLSNMDLWYVREAEEEIGPAVLYRVRLR